MNKTKSITSLAIASLAIVYCFNGQEVMGNPVQPWSGYKVHDKSRPNPVKATGGKCLSIAPPADATVCIGEGNNNAMKVAWPMADGVMVANKAGNNLTSESFSDCQIHIEWKVPKGVTVKGQKGGNSGLFIMGLYEVQIQESHQNVTYADGQAAAIYGQFPPLVNPALPQGEWQSYDIIFKAPVFKDDKLVSPANISVIFNGILVHANQPLKGPTTHRKLPRNLTATKHPEKAPHQLQWHQDKIEFRNFWVRDLTASTYSQKK